MRWFWYSVAIVATLLAVAGWVFAFGRVNRLATSVPGAAMPAGAVAALSASSPGVPPVRSPAPAYFQRACMSGVEWLYDSRSQRWFKPISTVTGKPLSCPMLSVREQLRADGATYVLPRRGGR